MTVRNNIGGKIQLKKGVGRRKFSVTQFTEAFQLPFQCIRVVNKVEL